MWQVEGTDTNIPSQTVTGTYWWTASINVPNCEHDVKAAEGNVDFVRCSKCGKCWYGHSSPCPLPHYVPMVPYVAPPGQVYPWGAPIIWCASGTNAQAF